jgi:pilus assembly protein CpaB
VKQKNLILMVVAVGCGLAAAFLTSRMSAKPATDQVPQKDVLVAAKDLNPPTKFTKEALKDLVKRKRMNAADVPDNAIESEEELIDMTLHRPVSANVFLQKTDVNKNEGLTPPIGKTGLMSVKLPLAQVTPFIKPTSRVNLVGTVTNRNNQKVGGRVLIPNMHVMAVDSDYIPAPGAATGRMQVQVITLAVSNEEATLIRMAETAGVTMSFVLIGNTQDIANVAEKWDINEVIGWVNDAVAGGGGSSEQKLPETNVTPAPAPTFVKVPVATEDLPTGTELTDDVITQKFRMVDFVEAPATAVIDLKASIGHFLAKEVSANQFLPKTAVSKTAPKKPEEPKPEVKPEVKPEIKPEAPPEVKPAPKEVKKKTTVDKSITGPSGTKTYRYEQQDDKTWKLLGEIQPDGSVTPVNGVAPAEKKQDKKDDAAPATGEGRIS